MSETLLGKFQRANGINLPHPTAQFDAADDRAGDDSFSGKERNHLFVNRGGAAFDDVSPLSGLDCLEDTRSSVIFDYDRDGWLDVALVNCNEPAFGIFRNNLGNSGDEVQANRIIAVRLVGGATQDHSVGFAPRDGYGAKVFVHADDKTYLRESRAGEGFAAQNSRTLLIGIGQREYADVEIRWPSGNSQKLDNVSAGTLLTCFENPSDSSDGSGFESVPYLRNASEGLLGSGVATNNLRTELKLSETEACAAPYKMVTTMATWCATCKGELPQLELLRAGFAPDELGMFGAPIDPNDNAALLSQYGEEFQPPYRLLTELPPSQREQVKAAVKQELGIETLPATLVLNADDEVIASFPSVPTVSALRNALGQ